MQLVGAAANRGAWPAARRCSIDRAFALIGTRSAMLLMREAYYGCTRFDEFVRRIGITEASASARLKDLVEAGLLERRPYQEPGARTRCEYLLTDAGTDLLPTLLGLLQWGDRHIASMDGGPPVLLRHQDCGAPVSVKVQCEAGHDVELDHIEVHSGVRTRPLDSASS